jgi:hypothetical protein
MITLVLTPISIVNGPSPEYRLRGLLKIALRQFGFRCVKLARGVQ